MSTGKRKVAVITAAGFKDVSAGLPGVPALCPEPLLPIGAQHGNTILERLAKQLKRLGYKVYTTVGTPGYVYDWRPTWNARYWGFEGNPNSTKISPWTEERIRYVSQFSTPLFMPDPDRACYHDSAFRAIDKIGYNWDRMLIAQGDHLYQDGLLADMVKLRHPCQVRPSRGGRAFTTMLLTPGAARLYRRLGDPYRAANLHEWNGSLRAETGFSAEGKEFAAKVPIVYVTDMASRHDEYEYSDDVDSPSAYQGILAWLEAGGRITRIGEQDMIKFDFCIKPVNHRTIYMVRGQQKRAFECLEDYEAMGRPDFEIVTEEEANRYATVKRFTEGAGEASTRTDTNV